MAYRAVSALVLSLNALSLRQDSADPPAPTDARTKEGRTIGNHLKKFRSDLDGMIYYFKSLKVKIQRLNPYLALKICQAQGTI